MFVFAFAEKLTRISLATMLRMPSSQGRRGIRISPISHLMWFSMVANSKILHCRSKNSLVVECQRYFVLERPLFQFHKQHAKFANEVHHLTRFFEKVDSQLSSRLMILNRQLLKMKNGRKLTKIAYKPNFSRSSTKQNDYVRMIFPENSSLQCFRKAPLSMVTPNTESRNPMDCLCVENHSKL